MTGLNVRLRPSLALASFIATIHLLAAVAVWFSALSLWICLALNTVVVLSLLASLRQHHQLGYRQLRYDDQQWWLADAAGDKPLELVGEYLLTPWLLVLRFTVQAGHRITLVLPSDSADVDDLRRLRVLLRFGLRSE